jgi:lysophospholipase L1-like esterase
MWLLQLITGQIETRHICSARILPRMSEQKLALFTAGEIRILAFGNSLTEGYTDFGTRYHPYAIALEKKLSSLSPSLKVTVSVEGQSGDRVLRGLGGIFLQRLQSACPLPKSSSPPKHDIVIVLGGTNDLGYMVNNPNCAPEIFEGLKECYEHVLLAGSALLCLTIPERAIDTRTSEMARRARASRLQLNELIAEYVQTHQATASVFMMDLARVAPFPADRAEDETFDQSIWSPDGLHMSSQGYDFVGEELAAFLYNILEKPAEEEKSS